MTRFNSELFPDRNKPSREQQSHILNQLLRENEQRIWQQGDLIGKVKVAFASKGITLERTYLDRPLLGVDQEETSKIVEDDGTAYLVSGHSLSIDLRVPDDRGDEAIYSVVVGDRFLFEDGQRLEPRGDFNEQEVESVADMVDELLIARFGGQIPDLDLSTMSTLVNE